MIRVETNDNQVAARLNRIAMIAADGSFDRPVEIAAWRSHAELVGRTPKRWTGILRRSWRVDAPGLGQRLIWNSVDGKTTNKVMLWIEQGTANQGTGFIYPRTKKALFIPKTARAAIGGWNPGLTYGVDYILRKKVRGITPRWIVREFRPRARAILREEMKAFLEKALS